MLYLHQPKQRALSRTILFHSSLQPFSFIFDEYLMYWMNILKFIYILVNYVMFCAFLFLIYIELCYNFFWFMFFLSTLGFEKLSMHIQLVHCFLLSRNINSLWHLTFNVVKFISVVPYSLH